MEAQAGITFAQLKTLYEVSQKVNSQLDLQKLLDEIMDLAIGLLHADKGLILLRDPKSGELRVHVARAMDKQTIQNVVAMSRSVVAKVGREARPTLMRISPQTRQGEVTDSALRFHINSLVCVPLRERDQVTGAIYLDSINGKHFFQEQDVLFLEAFANLAAIALQNARSYEAVRQVNANLESLVEQRTSELRKKHQELTDAFQQLKQAQLRVIQSEKMASLGRVVAGVAHEINSPLGSLNSNADLLQRLSSKLRRQLAELLANVPTGQGEQLDATVGVLETTAHVSQDACQRINGILKSLRSFARLDEEELKEVDIREGLESTLALLGRHFGDRIEIVREYGEVPALQCHAAQLNQVFLNVLLNACQAIPKSGKIHICTHATDGMVRIEFRDTGVGIAPDRLRRIFDPGFTTQGVGVGVGLGLPIAYQIMEEHNGTIEVESQLGQGSTVKLSLPTGKRHQDPARAVAAECEG